MFPERQKLLYVRKRGAPIPDYLSKRDMDLHIEQYATASQSQEKTTKERPKNQPRSKKEVDIGAKKPEFYLFRVQVTPPSAPLYLYKIAAQVLIGVGAQGESHVANTLRYCMVHTVTKWDIDPTPFFRPILSFQAKS